MTIQGKIQDVLSAMAGQEIEVIGSGRTDAGVHAYGQVANFHLPKHFKKDEILDYLNHYLPMDIAVLNIEEVDERFHARYHAESKTYIYRIHTSKIPNVFERKYMYTYTEKLDVDEMRNGAKNTEDIPRILESKIRENAGYTVPAEGLILYNVIYEI